MALTAPPFAAPPFYPRALQTATQSQQNTQIGMLTQPRIPTSSQQHLPTCTPRSTCFIKCPSKSSASRLTSALSPHHQQQRSATRRDVLVATAAASTMGTQPSTTTSGKLNTHDLLIVGPGVLGSYLGAQWKGQYGDATVVAQTNSTTNHARYFWCSGVMVFA